MLYVLNSQWIISNVITNFPIAAVFWQDYGSLTTECVSGDWFGEVRKEELVDLKQEPDDVCFLLYPIYNKKILFRSLATCEFSFDSYHTQPFYGPFSGTTGVSRCQKRTSGLYGAGKINRGIHIDHPDWRHSIWTNQCPPPPLFFEQLQLLF